MADEPKDSGVEWMDCAINNPETISEEPDDDSDGWWDEWIN